MVDEPAIETFSGECRLLSVSVSEPVKLVAEGGMKSTT